VNESKPKPFVTRLPKAPKPPEGMAAVSDMNDQR
jgi:hypothetical protein